MKKNIVNKETFFSETDLLGQKIIQNYCGL